MPSEDTKILEFNQYENLKKHHLLFIRILNVYQKRLMDLQITLKYHLRYFSVSTMSSFKSIESKHDVYRGRDCMIKFYESLREHALKIINFKSKKMKLLTKEQQESHENAKICYTWKEKFEKKCKR